MSASGDSGGALLWTRGCRFSFGGVGGLFLFLGLAARGAGGAGTGAWAAGGTGTGAGARGAEAGFAGDAIAIVIEPGLAALECLPGLLLCGVVRAAASSALG
jgi:hypothetical protein